MTLYIVPCAWDRGIDLKQEWNVTIATLSSKGQITLPAAARRALGLKAGDRITVEERGGEIVLRPARDFFALKGYLGRARPRDEERSAMRNAAAGEGGGGRT
jgi:AbrB family looped-hinge helix DNA binding protein